MTHTGECGTDLAGAQATVLPKNMLGRKTGMCQPRAGPRRIPAPAPLPPAHHSSYTLCNQEHINPVTTPKASSSQPGHCPTSMRALYCLILAMQLLVFQTIAGDQGDKWGLGRHGATCVLRVQ